MLPNPSTEPRIHPNLALLNLSALLNFLTDRSLLTGVPPRKDPCISRMCRSHVRIELFPARGLASSRFPSRQAFVSTHFLGPPPIRKQITIACQIKCGLRTKQDGYVLKMQDIRLSSQFRLSWRQAASSASASRLSHCQAALRHANCRLPRNPSSQSDNSPNARMRYSPPCIAASARS